MTPRRAPGLGGQICSVSLPGRCQILPHEFPVFAFVFFKILGLAVAAEITKIKDGVGGWTKRTEWKDLLEHSWDVCIPTGACSQSAKIIRSFLR